MQSWLAKKLITFVMGRTREGDVRPTLLLDASDVKLTFPGQSSWSGEFEGKAEVARWLRRFAAVGMQIFPDEVVAKGLPWRTTVCVRGHVYLRDPQQGTVYENRYVIWGRMAWGRLKEYEVYEDTHKADELDEYLTRYRPDLAVVRSAA